jgi:hypothetical protein
MMYPNQQPPMQGMANQMAQHGRYGDSMLVHMNPIEVQGLASLSPTGSLTVNPVTGQPEAFLPFLAPLLGSLAGSSLLTGVGANALGGLIGAGGLSSAAAGALGSGLATAVSTGDLKQGILAGLTGYGLGSALGGAADAMNPQIAGAEQALAGVGEQAATAASDLARSQAAQSAGQSAQQSTIGGKGGVSAAGQGGTPLNIAQQQANLTGLQGQQTALQSQIDTARQAMTPMDRLSAPFQQPGALGSAMMSPSTLVPIALGEGKREELRMQDEMDAMGRQEKRKRQEELDRAVGMMDASYNQLEQAYPGYIVPRGYRAGGITSVNPQNYMQNLQGLQRLAGGGQTNYSPVIDPRGAAQRQDNIRGSDVIKPSELQGYRPGFDPRN